MLRAARCPPARPAGRKQGADESPEVLAEVTQQLAAALSSSAAALLDPTAVKELGYDGSNDEFGQKLCEAMAAVAPHFAAVSEGGAGGNTEKVP